VLQEHNPPQELARTLWGIQFRAPVFNAAGMYKKAEGYIRAVQQGAGAFLAGTTTARARAGNTKKYIRHPFVPYPSTGAASNWMGLPNEGHSVVAARIAQFERVPDMPIGASVSAQPGDAEGIALAGLLEGMRQYERAGVDFIELNESCPNVAGHAKNNSAQRMDDGLIRRLEFIHHEFLLKRKRNVPVIVKFSNDTDSALLPLLIDLLITLRFDGVNFGNTSTAYQAFENQIKPGDLKAYKYFTKNFGGGLSGSILRQHSAALCTEAAKLISAQKPAHEFHIIRTGGLQNGQDMADSLVAGCSLMQWYTGYYEQFSQYGNKVYDHTYKQMIQAMHH
jgi:dihydroorotate dehydrogenase